MSVYHCPLCPLVFQSRPKVDCHIRDEHTSRADEQADLRVELAAATAGADWGRLGSLRASKARPSVSLLLSTAPAATMTVLDIARLRQLADRARRRLFSEPDRDTPAAVVEHRLSRAVSAAESLPTERGLAVLVNRHDIAILTLPFPPRDRQMVDGCFATRDVEFALRRFPQYRVLVLGRHPRMLEGRSLQLAPVYDRPDVRLQDAHRLLQARISVAGPLPLVVLGDRRHLAEFCHPSNGGSDVIPQQLPPWPRQVAIADLAARAVEGWLARQRQRAVVDLQDAERREQVVWGVEAAWRAVQSGAADRLWVEHDYAVPGRVLPGVYGVATTGDAAEPGVVDDMVDALMSRTAQLGVPVDILDRGTLGRPEPVAARAPVGAPAMNLHSRYELAGTT